MNRPYQICCRCIMDTSDPEITFNEKGICNHCTRYFSRIENEVLKGEMGKRKLDEISAVIKKAGKAKTYNCIIGISGGVDSTYVAYVVKKMGLNPIAVHLDNGWNSELAVENIRLTLEKLNIDLYTCVIDWEEFRDIQLSFFKAGVANLEIPTDHAIISVLYNIANKYGLKHIILGGNVITEGILPHSWGYYHQDYKHLKAIHKRFGKIAFKTFPRLPLLKFIYYLFVKQIKIVPLLNYVDYDKSKTIELLQKELGWRYYGGKHYESIFTRFFQGYILPKKFGYDKRRAHLSCLVCAGEMSREAALEEMERDPYAENNLEQDKIFVLKKLGMSEDDFSAYMLAENKSYKDYPSNALLFVKIQSLKYLVKKIATKA